MTAIAAVTHRGRVWMASDSRVSDGSKWATNDSRGKLRRSWRGDVVGYSGDDASRVLDRVDWTSADLAGEIEKQAEALGLEDFELLIGRGGKLWYYETGTLWPTAERYAAIGSGSLVCLGYLAGTVGLPPQDRVRGAVRAAIEHVPTCGGRVWILSSDR